MNPVADSLANDSSWMELFPEHWVTQGRTYQEEGRVSLQKCDRTLRGKMRVTALVQGSRPRPYEVDARLVLNSFGDLDVEGRCSCALGYNCRHVLGALIQAQRWMLREGGEETAFEVSGRRDARSPHAEWIGSLELALGSKVSRHGGRGIRYLLRPDRESQLCRLQVVSMKVGNGNSGDVREIEWAMLFDEQKRPAYVSPTDIGIVGEIQNLSFNTKSREGVLPEGPAWNALIDDIVATGRCHWVSPQAPPLRTGAKRPASFAWSEVVGDPVPILKTEPVCETFLPLSPSRYVDPASNEIGEIDLGEVPPAMAQVWLTAPPISVSDVAEIARLLRSNPELRSLLPIPESRQVEVRTGVKPQAILRLNKVNAAARRNPSAAGKPLLAINVADVQFEYLGRRVRCSDPSSQLQVVRNGGQKVIQIERDAGVEKDRIAELMGCGLCKLESLFPEGQVAEPYRGMLAFAVSDNPDGPGQEDCWISFVTGDVEDLKAEGWLIEHDPGFEFQVIEPDAWFGEVAEPVGGGRIDWFEFSFGIEISGRRINLLPTLVAYLASKGEGFEPSEIGENEEHVPIRIEQDGRYINFPADRLRRILTTLAELYDPESLRDETLPIHALRAADLASGDFADELFSSGRTRLQKLADRLASTKGVQTVDEPQGFKGTLRPYQKEGYSWLQFLAENGIAGILADDMGLGKTVQTLCHLAAEKASGRSGDLPSLIIAPTSVLQNWEKEANKFAPNLRVLVLYGPSRRRYFDYIGTSDLVVTSYPLLVRDEHALLRFHYHALVLDEAQLIKNSKSKAAGVASSLRAHHRVALTGTPVENHLGELWSIFNFLLPGFLGTEKVFQHHYRGPIEKDADEERQKELTSRVAPLMIRRTKRQVAKELPPKTEIIRQIPLAPDQAELYETVRSALDERLVEQIRERGLGGSGMLILDALMKLRQICCDPRLLKLSAAKEVKKSAKLETLMEFVPQLVESGHRILIFSQFTSMLSLIGEALSEVDIPFISLTGGTKNRGDLVDRFQGGEVPVFLISLMAGGTGLTLTKADTVIHYDPWWNPAVEAQASDRAYRIGQTNPVFVYKLITEGTVEEKILELQRRKSRLLQSIFAGSENGGETAPKFSVEDLRSLMSPLV